MHVYIINTEQYPGISINDYLSWFLILQKYPDKVTLITPELKLWEYPPEEQLFSVMGLSLEDQINYIHWKAKEGEEQLNFWIISHFISIDLLNQIQTAIESVPLTQTILNVICIPQNLNNTAALHHAPFPVIVYSQIQDIQQTITALTEWILSNQQDVQILKQIGYVGCSTANSQFNPQAVNKVFQTLKKMSTPPEIEIEDIPESINQQINRLTISLNRNDCSLENISIEQYRKNIQISHPEDAHRLPEWFNQIEKDILTLLQQNMLELKKCIRKKYKEIVQPSIFYTSIRNEILQIQSFKSLQNFLDSINTQLEELKKEQQENDPLIIKEKILHALENLEQHMFQAVNRIKRTIAPVNIFSSALISIFLIGLSGGSFYLSQNQQKSIGLQSELYFFIIWLISLIGFTILFALFLFKIQRKKIYRQLNMLIQELIIIKDKLNTLYEAYITTYTLQLKQNIILQLKQIINEQLELLKKRSLKQEKQKSWIDQLPEDISIGNNKTTINTESNGNIILNGQTFSFTTQLLVPQDSQHPVIISLTNFQ